MLRNVLRPTSSQRLPRRFSLIVMMALLTALLMPGRPALAAPSLSINLLTWHMAGLDSNNVNAGPNEFPLGARVCNTSAEPAYNVTANVVWETANPYINIKDLPSLTLLSLAAGACHDFYYTVVITRDPAAYFTTRAFYVSVSATGVTPITTARPREIYVEKLLSQARNTVLTISGPTSVYLGETYQYTLTSDTAPQGYEQLTTFLNYPNSMFQIVDISTTYTAPAGGTNDTVYADACGWQPNPTLPNYMSCVGPPGYAGGKVGGRIVTVYTVKVVGAGTASMSNLIFDKSGSSYHYNSDFGVAPLNVIVVNASPALTSQKADLLVGDNDANGVVSAGDTIRYQITITNVSPEPATGVAFTDVPDANTNLIVGTVQTTQGTVVSGNTPGATAVSVNVGVLAPGASVTITFDAMIDNPLAAGVTQIANQGTITNNDVPVTVTDDPDTATPGDPTITPIGAPTAINLMSFTGEQRGNSIVLGWETSWEQNTMGFHLYRSTDGERASATRVTPQLVLAQGGSNQGASYSWVDTNVERGQTYSYWLEEVDGNGATQEAGPVVQTLNHQVFLPIVQ